MTMTKKQAEKEFNREIKPSVIERYGKNDKTAQRTAWNDYTDSLHRDGQITNKQRETWDSPIK